VYVIEVAVRLVVRDSFKDILGGVVVSPTELKALEEALFEVVYPSFGGRCGCSPAMCCRDRGPGIAADLWQVLNRACGNSHEDPTQDHVEDSPTLFRATTDKPTGEIQQTVMLWPRLGWAGLDLARAVSGQGWLARLALA
jgi:hypothetical protein